MGLTNRFLRPGHLPELACGEDYRDRLAMPRDGLWPLGVIIVAVGELASSGRFLACQARRPGPEYPQMFADEQPSPQQLAVFRGMRGQRRLRLAEQLYWSARKMKAAGLRSQHPEWSEERVNAEVRRIFLHARS